MYQKVRFECSLGIYEIPIIMSTVAAALLASGANLYAQLLGVLSLYSLIVRSVRLMNIRFFAVDNYLCFQERVVFKRQVKIDLIQVVKEPIVRFGKIGFIFDYGTVMVKSTGGKTIKAKYIRNPEKVAREIDLRRRSYREAGERTEKIVN